MDEIFNGILIIVLLLVLYLGIQKYKKTNRKESDLNQVTESFNMDKIYYNPPIETAPVQFDYENTNKPIDDQFMKEQDFGVNLSTWYPNTWIESIGDDGEPIYGSREPDKFVGSGTRLSYEFNVPRLTKMDGAIDPNDITSMQGKPIKEIYENAFVDYRKLTPKKNVIINGDGNGNNYSLNGASNLSFNMPDTWVYQDEKPENGGKITNEFYASDPYINDAVAIF